ncbi:MAG: VOC family protein [Minisyncoccota bacterium]
MNKVVHFEIPADDMDRAKKFYGSVFGWGLQDYPMPDGMKYTGITTTPADEKTHLPTEPGAINGGMMERTKDVPAPVIAISVDSVDEYIEKIEAAGCKVVMPKKEIVGMGFYAYVTDTEGNVIGLWQALK